MSKRGLDRSAVLLAAAAAALVAVLGVVASYSACESEARLQSATDLLRDETRRVRELAPDPGSIPAGASWWCYAASFESDDDSECARARPDCESALERARLRAPEWSFRACERTEEAACFTCRDGGAGTARCFRTLSQCATGRDLFLASPTPAGACSRCDSVR